MSSHTKISPERSVAAEKLASRFENLSTDEVLHADGNHEQLIGLVMLKTGQSREEIEPFVRELAAPSEASGTPLDDLRQQASLYADAANRSIQEGYSSVSNQALQQYVAASQALKQRPVESVAAALAVGLVTGIAIGLSIAGNQQKQQQLTWRDRWLS